MNKRKAIPIKEGSIREIKYTGPPPKPSLDEVANMRVKKWLKSLELEKIAERLFEGQLDG